MSEQKITENCISAFKVKSLKLQNPVYCPEEKEPTKAEYLRLLAAATSQPGCG